MLFVAVRVPLTNRRLSLIPDDEVPTPTTIRRPWVPRMGICVPLRPPASSTASNLRSPQQSRNGVENRNSSNIMTTASGDTIVKEREREILRERKIEKKNGRKRRESLDIVRRTRVNVYVAGTLGFIYFSYIPK